MKELDELILPDDLRYSKEHEWARVENDLVVIGITDYAQDQLGDIVFVEMPEEGESFSAGEEFGTLESVKAVSELYIPVSGEVVAVNEELDDSPELLNRDPYENWILKIHPEELEEMNDLMAHDSYMKMLEGE